MKRIISLLLAALLAMSLVITAAAETADPVDEAPAAESNTISFDTASAGWTGFGYVFCHIWAIDDPDFVGFDWGGKKQRCTDEDGDGIWSYDLDKAGLTIKPECQYAAIFANDNGDQTYNLLFGAPCIGKTAACDGTVYENPADSSKTTTVAFWSDDIDATVYGPELTITSIGNVVGTCCPASTTPYNMFVNFLKNTLDNAREYSGKDDQTLIDDIAKALGLSDEDVQKAIEEAGVTVAWTAGGEATADEPVETDGPDVDPIATPDEPVATPDEPDEPVISGGWEFSDIAADNVTADEQAVLDKALEELVGVDYVAVDVIATQIVAGTNYAFLCKSTPVVPDAESYWTVVTVYEDLEGNASVENIVVVDPADMKTKVNSPDDVDNGWTSEPEEERAPIADNIWDALRYNVGLMISPIAVIGTQVVAGTNYCILAYGTTSSLEPITYLCVVYVYEDLEGNANITSLEALDLNAYVTAAPVEPATEDEATPDEPATEDEATPDEPATEDEPATDDEATPDEPATGDEATPDEPLAGDVNGDGKVDNRDAMILDRYVAGWDGYAERVDMDAADVSGDGQVNNRDAMILDRYVAGWDGYDQYIA